MDGPRYPQLVGDIGGTNARFAWIESPGAAPSDVRAYAAAEYPSLIEAMRHYLREAGKPVPPWCAIGIANPVTGDHVKMTNHDWSFSISALRRELGLERFLVLNDFTALALALPGLGPQDLRQLGGAPPVPQAPLGLVGPGTGLGVSGLLPAAPGRPPIPLTGEGGHVTLAPADDHEARIVDQLRQRFGHASAERAVSGPGLVNLYQAVCTLQEVAPRPLDAADISLAAVRGDDAQCVEALELMCSFLGNVAGNLALTVGARGGVYIGGGIVPKLGDWFERSKFRSRFEDKGRFRSYLQPVPVFVVHARHPALSGAAYALQVLPPGSDPGDD
ncbi:glucokinase [Aquabacterium sp. A7-Y]|uniref:glucokinase n=1 Tax=Aquabacterium sp. A7-Y TaxID=1349605 RepID=UPI00223E56B1|nr:glucokinase [Aquabacterium sp. A7-Y]MCW7538890.1 glucokinase [Aquabacterium sp. A7-Y]